MFFANATQAVNSNKCVQQDLWVSERINDNTASQHQQQLHTIISG
jgi:hypothetical protein